MMQQHLSRRRSGPLVAIPEESSVLSPVDQGYNKLAGDLGSDPPVPLTPSPQPQIIVKHPIPRRGVFRRSPSPSPSRKSPGAQREKEAERDCGICFELAVTPVRTRCCSHLFCADHIVAWLHGPASDGLCPACGAPGLDSLLALGHPVHIHPVPPPPPPTPRSPSPASPSSSPMSSSTSAAPYASYPSVPAVLPSPFSSRPDSMSRGPGSSSSHKQMETQETSEEEHEDATDYSLPALVRARLLQTRRHTPHPFTSVFGVRAALGRVLRISGWLVLVAVLAWRAREGGRWAEDGEGE